MPTSLHRLGHKSDDSFDMAGRIVAALRLFGGEAHRRLVIEYIQSSSSDPGVRKNIEDAVVATFERLAADQAHDDALFYRRFGPGSQRWSLGPAADRGSADTEALARKLVARA